MRRAPTEYGGVVYTDDKPVEEGAMRNIPKELDRMSDVVLAYRSPEKGKASKRREKRRRKRNANKG